MIFFIVLNYINLRYFNCIQKYLDELKMQILYLLFPYSILTLLFLRQLLDIFLFLLEVKQLDIIHL